MLKLDKHTKLFVILVFLIPLSAFAIITWLENRYQQLPVLGGTEIVNGVEKDFTVMGFEFINQNNKLINESSWDDKIVIVDFFFTHCPSICPAMTSNMKRVQESFQNDENIQLASFTVDPERDNPAKLNAYAKKFSLNEKNWDLLTGKKEDLYRFARKGLFLVTTDGDGGDNDFIHSERLVLIDKQKRIRGYYDGTENDKVNNLINDIKKLKNEN